jgi:MFS family permease
MTEWHEFFIALAVAGATTFVVLVATLQVTAHRWRSSALRRVAAGMALVQLLVPLVAALVALMPGEESWRVGYMVMGSVGIGALVWQTVLYQRHESVADGFDDRQRLLQLTAFLGTYFALVVFGAKGDGASPYVVAALSVWLLVSGTVGVWLLLDQDPPAHRPSTISG